ncbi:hypothetical protein SAMD00019534_095000 [Acytostelium subglobosum LB1]|uniref:hypothetical protein n=1 Tax=Acytostelium subglobosum LB1 TaxID=1410327 RepID=UPI0006448384|nr:hypothetical protein SAMD00019534_095000 [Acytostelium subglobosum LB1]GAM26325.1 hypothetical protein SAMD00019534_095000 [Acytostelium subglobosum LB1]|eukprot:XP_012750879.1 hypothetical protein SAMD00019534_095000 [Acytostelium subglobosum LB1]
MSEDEISSLPAGQLKQLIIESGGKTDGLFEKSDLVEYAKHLRSTLPTPVDEGTVATPEFQRKKVKVDYYEVLKVAKTATPGEIRKAYYKLATEFHPDKNRNDPRAEEMFKEISEAYQILSDPEKRQRYDQFGFDGMDDMMIDPLALFRLIFGGGLFQDFNWRSVLL